MKVKRLLLCVTLMLIAACLRVAGQGTAFNYQGNLNDGTNPATGSYDLTFTLFPTINGTLAATVPLTNAATAVNNGLFTVPLDFGTGVFNGTSYWLEIGIRTNGGGSFTTLAPRQPVTPTPYAIYSANAGSANSIAASNIVGTLPLAQLPVIVMTNNENGVTLGGTFNGNGGGLTNLNLTGPSSISVLGNFAGGYQALAANTTGGANIADGWNALHSNTTGTDGTADGYEALYSNTTGDHNTADGSQALQANTTGHGNTATGFEALQSNTTGDRNTADGGALVNNTTGNDNTAIGDDALYNSTIGDANIAAGYQAGYNITTGSSNIDIGNLGLATDSNIIRIGSGQTRAFIAGIITGNGGGLTNISAGTATVAANFSGSLAGNVTGTQSATVIASVGGQSATNIALGVIAANAATSTNTPGAIVLRDASGNFSGGAITAGSFTGNGGGLTNLPAAAIVGGITTNLAVLVPGGGTNTLHFINGVLMSIQ